MKSTGARVVTIAKWVILSPFLALLAAVALPVIFLIYVGRFVGSLWYVIRLRAAWPSGKFVLLAYTESELWAPFIETELLPVIAEHCVVVNRSRESWKRDFPVEHGALAFWGGWRSYNPIAIVLRPSGLIRVFRLYEPFMHLRKGQSSSLDSMTRELVRCVREIGNVGT